MAKLVRPDDVVLLLEKIRERGIGSIVGKFFDKSDKVVTEAWGHVSSTKSSWWDVEAVTARWNLLITGKSNLAYQQYVANKYLKKRRPLKGISLGCGTGGKEIVWASTGKFAVIDAFDISPQRIEFAREEAKKNRFGRHLNFQVGNVHKLSFPRGTYDVVIFDNSLHHLSPLMNVIDKVANWMDDKGILIMNEFVGPDRFQWTDEQVNLTNNLLKIMPQALRRKKDGTIKERLRVPGLLAMKFNDPSEAAESQSILKTLMLKFRVVELKPYGGTVLANLLKDIAHNFTSTNKDAIAWLQILFDVEDRMLEEARIPSDYVFGIFRK